MKRVLLFIAIGLLSYNCYAQNIGIGTPTPNASAKLEVTSTTAGFLPPRMTFAQRNAIPNPAQGLIIYCTDCTPNGQLQNFDGVNWQSMVSGLAIPVLATISTTAATSITTSSAISGGNITSDGGAMITRRGLIYSTSAILDTTSTVGGGKIIDASTGAGSYSMPLTGLLLNTVYHIRAFAVNMAGVSYGADISFSTLSNAANLPSVTICSQIWTSKNLDVTTYRDGSPIVFVEDPTAWANATYGAWCYYQNDPTNNFSYGKLYNWYAVHDPRGLAPQGWHVPTDAEWSILTDTCLGSWTTAGGPLKSVFGFNPPNTGATNSTGFAAVAGGDRSFVYTNLGLRGQFWTSTLTTNPYFVGMYYADTNALHQTGQSYWGLSVRLVKD